MPSVTGKSNFKYLQKFGNSARFMKTYKSVDEYIEKADKDKQKILSEIRKIVRGNFKKAEEEISYGMPSYKYKGRPFFYFAAMKGHLGLYPTPGPIAALQKELTDFSTSKGCIRVPYSQTLPKGLVLKLLKERMREIESEI